MPKRCAECDGTKVRKFCPSTPDKCAGCEEEPCPACNGTGEKTKEAGHA